MSLDKFFIISSLAFCLFGFGCANQSFINNIPNEVSEPIVSTENNNQPIVDNNLPPQWIEAPNSSVSESVDIQNWKNYNNETYNFSFDYPEDWSLFILEDHAVGFGVKINDSKESEYLPSPLSNFNVYYYKDFKIFIDQFDQNSPDSVLETVHDLSKYILVEEDPGITLLKETTVDSQPAYEFVFGGQGTTFSILIEDGEGLYMLNFQGLENREQLSPAQQQILTSFKFSDK